MGIELGGRMFLRYFCTVFFLQCAYRVIPESVLFVMKCGLVLFTDYFY